MESKMKRGRKNEPFQMLIIADLQASFHFLNISTMKLNGYCSVGALTHTHQEITINGFKMDGWMVDDDDEYNADNNKTTKI